MRFSRRKPNFFEALLLTASLALLAGCARGALKAASVPKISAILPLASEVGSAWRSEPKLFDRRTLFELIDGEAELFFTYAFERVASATYSFEIKSNEGTAASSVEVRLYDMTTSLNAFGIFSNYRSTEGDFPRIGAAAFEREGFLVFFKGRYFAHLFSEEAPSETNEVLRHLALAMESRISGEASLPQELALLPEEGLIPGSVRFVPAGLEGLQFMGSGFEAQYKANGQVVDVFLAIFKSEEEALRALKSYAEAIGTNVEGTPPEKEGSRRLSATVAHKGIVLAAERGRFVVGVSNLKEPEEGYPLLEKLLSHLADKN